MEIKSARFVISSTDISKCPKPNIPEFAFIGRSNVGKSSLINMLCNKKGLAKTSSQPGKTQCINHFIIDDNWYLVDLPGYGFAKVSKTQREKWQKFIDKYLLYRENLICVFVLIDSRIEPQMPDLEFMLWLGNQGIPFSMIFTKTDKIGTTQIEKNIAVYKKTMLNYWEELPPMFISSAVSKRGKEEILNYIEQYNHLP
ncbi:MAG: ribosome biogenesis GTP-binding protein YihA/YsxC [Bacteroidota bacterium]|nr:ribosome biogenesis GTP-binding protein YihA/YsxC [Bacteroidota bacterium]MDP4205016.1 ribosome biogenesis GTP-binding protein YihA/YsxC [Bacteroidota bacterium]